MKCISRDAFVEWLKRIPIKDLSDGLGLCRIIMADDFERAIKELPSDMVYDAEPIGYGYWISFRSEATGDIQCCSACGIGSGAKTKYCPNCGNRDHDTLNVARRTCGYIGSNFWNRGRTQEIKERVLHIDNKDDE